MKIKLNMTERINLAGILPKKGNIVLLKAVNEINEELMPSKKERETYGIIPGPGGKGVQWKGQPEDKEFDFENIIFEEVKTILLDLEKNKQLHMEQISLYEKFVELKG